MRVPLRGEIYMVDLGLAAKVRPCLVLSIPPQGPERALITLLPHTTSTRQTRFEVVIPLRFLRPGAFDAQGIVTVPSARLMNRLGALRKEQMQAIEGAVCAWLGIERAPSVQAG